MEKKSLIAAGMLYLLALPGFVLILLTSQRAAVPAILPIAVTIACIHIGLALGPALGFRSLILDKICGRRLTGLGSGMACVAIGTLAMWPICVIPARMLVASGLVKRTLIYTDSLSIGMFAAPVLIGGVIEELIYRWGGMSLGVFLLWKMFDRGAQRPGRAFYWVVLVVTAASFGLTHLLHVWHHGGSALEPYGLFFVGFTFIDGLIIGWIFWKKGLEFAIATHVLTTCGKLLIFYYLRNL